MKKMMFTLVALLTMAASARAMSYEQARNEALFLTDKMAYELNLTDAQYEAAYEINLDYLMGVTSQYDVFGPYWERRNLDLSYILFSWQWDAFCAASYFYRPLYWNAGYWHFGVYARYPHRDHFFFGRPGFYISYRGGHSWRLNGGRSFYEGRRDHYRPSHIDRDHHFGMRNSWDRGDFRNNHGGSSSTNHGFHGNNRDNRDNHGGFRGGMGNDRGRNNNGMGNHGGGNNGNMGNHGGGNHNGSMGNHGDNGGMNSRSGNMGNHGSNRGTYSNSHGNFGGSRSNYDNTRSVAPSSLRSTSPSSSMRSTMPSNSRNTTPSMRSTSPSSSSRSSMPSSVRSSSSQRMHSSAPSGSRSSAPAVRSSSSGSHSSGSIGSSHSGGSRSGGSHGGSHGGGSHGGGHFGGSRR